MRTLTVGPIMLVLFSGMMVAAVANGEVLLHEDFEDGIADGFTVLDGAWDVVEYQGNLVYQGFGDNARVTFGDPAWTDYWISGRFYFPDTGEATILFRIQDIGLGEFEGHYYQEGHKKLSNNMFLNWMHDDIKTNLTEHAVSWQSGRWYEFELRVEGDRMDHYIDGQLVDSYQGLAYLSGYVGLKSFAGHNVYFDDIVVAVPEPATLCLLVLGGLAALRRKR